MSTSNNTKEPPDIVKCRRYIYIFLLFIFVWVVVYLPILYSYQIHPHRNISWMIEQRDLQRFIAPNNLTILLSPNNSCKPSTLINKTNSTQLVIVVFSSLPNTQARQAIRETWANKTTLSPDVSVYFLVGSSYNTTIEQQLQVENDNHGDIIQEDFLDSYNNLTLKSVMMLKWLNQNCRGAKYVMKTDDDMFVNVANLLVQMKFNKRDKLLLGCLINNAVPVKDWNSKWYAPDEVFSSRHYPKYLSGTGYVMSTNIVPDLYRAALKTPFFYLEDVFITGMCAHKIGVEPLNHPGFKFFKRKNDPCLFRSIITGHKMSPKDLHSIWTKIHNKGLKCVPVTKPPTTTSSTISTSTWRPRRRPRFPHRIG